MLEMPGSLESHRLPNAVAVAIALKITARVNVDCTSSVFPLHAAAAGEVPPEAVPVMMIDYMGPSLDTADALASVKSPTSSMGCAPEVQVRSGLSAGGQGIRTLGPAVMEKTVPSRVK